jgi:uncharacterized protein YwqG
MSREQILEAITASELRHLRDPLAEVLKPSIRVAASAIGKQEHRVLGSSRFGGLPDLPAGSEWPTVDGIRLMFLGQLDLKDLAPFEASAVLPSNGLLSFFFDGMLTDYERGEAPDRGRVIYTDTTVRAGLVRLQPPADVPEQFEVYSEMIATFEGQWTMPEFEEIDGDEFPMVPAIVPIIRTSADRWNYQKIRKKVRGKYIGSKLLGYADAVQGGEILFMAVKKQDQEKRFRYEDYKWTNLDELVAEMRDMCLLFQAACGKRQPWRGPGVVYFWIRRQDLENVCFDRSFAQLQST